MRKKRMLAALMALTAALTLTACGGSGMNKSASTAAGMDIEAPMAVEEPADMSYGGGMAYQDSGESGAVQGQKLIRRAELTLETTSFDEALKGLAELTERMGGYYEASSVGQRGAGYRWADYTVRVPAERYEDFLNQAGELCHETWRSATQEDVSEAYYDTAGRLKTQQIKLERLQELLGRAEAMEDIITIENAISETEQRIDQLSGTLQHYDALVDYATVNISLSEVYKLSNVEETPDSFASRLGQSFSNGVSDFLDSLEDLAVAFAYSWMWWLLLAAAVAVVVRLVRRRGKGFRFSLRRKKQDDNTPKT